MLIQARKFVLFYCLSRIPNSLNESLRFYLCAQKIFFIFPISQLISILIQILGLMIFVGKYELGIVGAGLSLLITESLVLLIVAKILSQNQKISNPQNFLNNPDL